MFKKILVLLILLIIAISIVNRKTEAPVIEEKSPNDIIISAFQDFKTFAQTKPTVAAETLCQGGFINTTQPELQKVSTTIIENRIDTKNQDEAGITCLSEAEKWVLFSALNNNEYYCIDSTGISGKYGIDRKNLKCQTNI